MKIEQAIELILEASRVEEYQLRKIADTEEVVTAAEKLAEAINTVEDFFTNNVFN